MAWWWIFRMFISCLQLGSLHFFRSLHFYHRNAVTSSLPSWPLLASLANFRTSSASLAVTMKDSCQGKRHGDDHHFNQPKKQWHPFFYRKISRKIWPFCIVHLFDSPPKKMGNVQDPCHSCIGVSLESCFFLTWKNYILYIRHKIHKIHVTLFRHYSHIGWVLWDAGSWNSFSLLCCAKATRSANLKNIQPA